MTKSAWWKDHEEKETQNHLQAKNQNLKKPEPLLITLILDSVKNCEIGLDKFVFMKQLVCGIISYPVETLASCNTNTYFLKFLTLDRRLLHV